MKTFQKNYKNKYNLEFYHIECIVHTLNNIIQDILKFLLFDEKDDQEIRTTINVDENNEEEILNQNSSKFFY